MPADSKRPPAEVEAMMYENPAVRECRVISSPDSYRGKR
jgi:acyl-coenzyme A synthetase/AMP-(fatty) acid ligase